MTLCCLLLAMSSIYVAPYRLQAKALDVVKLLGGEFTSSAAEGSAWHRWLVTTLLGEDAFANVIKVQLAGQNLDDDTMHSLAGLIHLRELDLDRVRISDQGVAEIGSMKDLQILSLRYAGIDDSCAPILGELVNLKTLYLTGNPLTDAAVDDLAKLDGVQEIYIRWTRITEAGEKSLAEALPNCAVYHHALVPDPTDDIAEHHEPPTP